MNARDLQYDRIKQQLDSTFDTSFGVPGLSAEDEIARLQLSTRKQISEAYQQAKDEGLGGVNPPSRQGELDLPTDPQTHKTGLSIQAARCCGW